MTASPTKRYEHFDYPVEFSEPVISGVGKDAQCWLSGRVNKWIRLNRVPYESDADYSERLANDNLLMDNYRSHLLMADSHNTSSSRLVAIASSSRCIGYSWMPVLGEEPITFEFSKAIAIWMNSTLGRISLRSVGARTVSFPKFRPVSFDAVKFPDVDDDCVVSRLASCFEETCNEEVPQFRQGRVAIREAWDDAVASALEIDRNLIAECAERLACDPFVSKDKFWEIDD